MKDLLVSRKFWALVLGLIVLIVGVAYPGFQLDEEQTIGLVIIVMTYILGVAVDPGPGGWRGVLQSRKFWAAMVGLLVIFTKAFGLSLPNEITPELLVWVCVTIGTYITGVAWEMDAANIPIGGWGLQVTPRDMAKLGYLYLHNGTWDGQQIVSAEWVRAATSKHTETDSRIGLGYGYQWWTYPSYGAYAALGRYGQTIFVAPDLDLVVVTTAQVDGHDPLFALIEEFVVPAVKTP